jgi:hypothetical protein
MAKKKNKEVDAVAELLKDLLIVQLGNAGVPKQEIRKIVGCDMNRVSRITKFLGNAK